MCSYKVVHATFGVWGFQTRVEAYIHHCIREVLLLGHRQAFAWIDDWIDMSMQDVRDYERHLQEETNKKLALKRSGSTVLDTEPAADISTPIVCLNDVQISGDLDDANETPRPEFD